MNKRRSWLMTVLLLILITAGFAFALQLNNTPNNPVDLFDHQKNLYANAQVWGLGETITTYKSNDRDYLWYFDQADSGIHSGNNCGPSSIQMVGKRVDKDFKLTAEDIRKDFRPLGGWWYGEDINGSLDKYKIVYQVKTIEDKYDLMFIIDAGNIAIINNNMDLITRNPNENQRTNRYYDYVTGHYFVVKGYLTVDNKTFFEVYDPNNWSATYQDGTPKGQNRYYEAETLLASMLQWYNQAVVIYPKAN
ncbi:MAG: hypothetical protein Q8N92_05690 [Erysipelotrichaceae bacterium]|nr:hypothetical protein [Erysipelotrichaceae bacterium]